MTKPLGALPDGEVLKSETVGAARRRLALLFKEAGIESAELDARLLVGAAARLDHAGLVRDPARPLDHVASHRLKEFVGRRLRREPVSRILGHREFWGLDFVVSDAVLDPRPETEGVVASALDALGGRRNDPLQILELGVGSGAILTALLSEMPAAWGVGVDRSEAACRTAQVNVERHGLASRAGILCADWAQALSGRFDLVVSNPPYIASTEIGALDREVREHDPILALDGGLDGLDAYRAILPCLFGVMAPSGVACLECGKGQGVLVSSLMIEASLTGATVYRDYSGHDRIVVAGRNP